MAPGLQQVCSRPPAAPDTQRRLGFRTGCCLPCTVWPGLCKLLRVCQRRLPDSGALLTSWDAAQAPQNPPRTSESDFAWEIGSLQWKQVMLRSDWHGLGRVADVLEKKGRAERHWGGGWPCDHKAEAGGKWPQARGRRPPRGWTRPEGLSLESWVSPALRHLEFGHQAADFERLVLLFQAVQPYSPLLQWPQD